MRTLCRYVVLKNAEQRCFIPYINHIEATDIPHKTVDVVSQSYTFKGNLTCACEQCMQKTLKHYFGSVQYMTLPHISNKIAHAKYPKNYKFTMLKCHVCRFGRHYMGYDTAYYV